TFATMPADITALAAEPSGTALVGLATGEVDAVDPNGHVTVVTDLASTPTAIVVDGATAWVGSEDGTLMRLSTADGRLAQTELSGGIVDAAAVGDGSIAVVTQDPSQITIQRKGP